MKRFDKRFNRFVGNLLDELDLAALDLESRTRSAGRPLPRGETDSKK